MAKYVLIVETSAVAGREDDFNDWYDTVHIPEVLEVPGIVAAERYELHGAFIGDDPVNRFMAIYEFDTDDPDATLKALDHAVPGMRLSEAWDNEPTRAVTYRMITPRIDRGSLARKVAAGA